MTNFIWVILVVIYILSIFVSVLSMMSKNIEPGCLSMFCVMTPILNTYIAIRYSFAHIKAEKSKARKLWKYEKDVFMKIFTFKKSEK